MRSERRPVYLPNPPGRATDLLRAGDGSFAAIRTDIETICSTGVDPDAVELDPVALRIAPQGRAFARRADLAVGLAPGAEILSALRPFLLPVLDDLREAIARPGTWVPGGPWRSEGEATR